MAGTEKEFTISYFVAFYEFYEVSVALSAVEARMGSSHLISSSRLR